jgi:hypothetical protein
MADPFSKLFEDYPLTQADKLKAPLTPSSVSTGSVAASPTAVAGTHSVPTTTFAAAAHLFTLPQQQPQQQPKKIRRLPRDIIKAGEYGPEYEEWRRKEEEREEQERREAEQAALRAAMPVESASHSNAPLQEQRQPQQQQTSAGTRPPRQKKPSSASAGNKMKVEVVERGVPKKQWFLIKWMVSEDKTSEEGDAVVLFEEDLKVSREVWSLALVHRKPRGSTHCQKDSKIGRYFAAYVRPDGSVLCRSSTVLIGPKVLIRAELKGNAVAAKYRIDPKDMSSWDWIGVFFSTQEENYTDYVTWCYVDTGADIVALERPVTPGDYVVCYFSSQKKYCPMAFSNFVNVPDPNELVLEGEGVHEPGGKVTASINIKSHSRDPNDWIGLYKYHEHKKHLFLARYATGFFFFFF